MTHAVDGWRTTRRRTLLRAASPTVVTAEGPSAPVAASSPAPRGAARMLRRVPVETAAAVLASVVAVAAVRGVAPVVVAAVAVVALVQVFSASSPAGARMSAVLATTVRAVAVPLGALALLLFVADLPHRAVDDTLLLGAVAAVVAGLGAALTSHRTRPPRVVVVGDLPQVRGLVARWTEERSVDVVGGLAVGAPAEQAEAGLGDLGIEPVASLAEVPDHSALRGADLVVAASGPALSAPDVRRLSWALQSSPARLAVLGVTEHVAPHRLDLAEIAGSTMSVVSPAVAPRPSAALKSGLDRALAMLGLVVVAPLLALLCLAIRLDTRGPAVFTQTRVGRDGGLFTVYKLRTMTADAEDHKAELRSLDEGNGVLFKIREDPRVTRVGRLLRRTSLDELPQLLNVVKGEMSLVGPRPALPEEVARYTELERRRLVVRPGITGLWQVSGRSSLGRDRSMHLDSSYADNWRVRGDLLILLRTVGAVLSRKGAY